MTWSSTAPDGTRSVKANESILQGNTTYIQNTMGNIVNNTTNTNAVRDHFWNVDPSLDGRHRYINMPTYTISGTAADPLLGASMQSVTYTKTRPFSPTNATNDVGLYFKNSDAPQIMQLLGIKACILFDITPVGNNAITPVVNYAFNATVSQISAWTSQVDRTFTINFTNALTSDKYFVLAGSILTQGQSQQQPIVYPAFATGTVKTQSLLKMYFPGSGQGSGANMPLQAWVMCFGG